MELLANRTWRDLRLTAFAHGLRFNTNHNKHDSRQFVRHALLQEGKLRHSLRALSPAEREPLQALQSANGSLSLPEFTNRYGAIRPYKPWREDNRHETRFLWKRPISIAEKLWHLGLIEIQRGKRGKLDTILLPHEVHQYLPPLPIPAAIHATPQPTDAIALPSRLLRDLGALLAGLLAGEGRWTRHHRLTSGLIYKWQQRYRVKGDTLQPSEKRAVQAVTGEEAAQSHGLQLEVVKFPEAKKGFVLLPRRWVVERSFGWMARFRRLARDYERLPETLKGLHFLAFAILMAHNFVQLTAHVL